MWKQREKCVWGVINSNSRCLRKWSKLWSVIFTKQQHQDEMGLMGKQVYRLHVKVLMMYGPLRCDGNCLRVGWHTSRIDLLHSHQDRGCGVKGGRGSSTTHSQLWKQNFILTLVHGYKTGDSEAEHKLFFWAAKQVWRQGGYWVGAVSDLKSLHWYADERENLQLELLLFCRWFYATHLRSLENKPRVLPPFTSTHTEWAGRQD